MSKRITNQLWWVDILNNHTNARVESLQVWNYIFKSEDGIEKRIEEYIGETETDPLLMKLKYLDLLMTLAAIDENMKGTLMSYVNRYLYDDSLSNKPVLISIESAIRVSSSEMFDKTYAYMSSTDYLMFMYGAVKEHSVYNLPKYPDQVTRHSTKSIVENSYKSSYDVKDNLTRLTEIYQKKAPKKMLSPTGYQVS